MARENSMFMCPGKTYPFVTRNSILEDIIVNHLRSEPVSDRHHHAASMLGEILSIGSICIKIANSKPSPMIKDPDWKIFHASHRQGRENPYCEMRVDRLVRNLH